MGACGSSMTAEQKAEKRKNDKLEADNKRAHQLESQKLKLLLLGAGESGKSTLFKQMKILFSLEQGFSQAELQAGVKVVFNNILTNLKIILSNCESHTPAEDSSLADELMGLDESTPVDVKLAEKLKSIWMDPGVVETWKSRSNFQVQEALEYFMDNIDRIAKPGYIPSNDDMLRTRVRTSGIVQAEYTIKDVTVAMFDVGGQRNERKKWMFCFDNVTAVIFVAAISEYDQVLFEDQHTNRQEEAVQLFKEMCDSKWFKGKSMILFLNKRDSFRKKLTYVPFKVEEGPNARNTDYKGPVAVPNTASAQDGTREFEEVYNATLGYLENLYRRQNSDSQREIYIKATCATDSDQVKTIMESCKDIILKNNLSDNGFL